MAADTDTQKTMTLTDNDSGSSVELPVIDGSVGPDVLDIRKLYGETGMFTFDPGYGATGSCKSGLTYICLLYTSPSPRDNRVSRMPSSA